MYQGEFAAIQVRDEPQYIRLGGLIPCVAHPREFNVNQVLTITSQLTDN